MKIRSRIIKYGDDVNTDVIFPGRYLEIVNPEEMAKHAMEDIDENFLEKVKNAKIIVAGKNFGCGSSREQAVTCLKYAGVQAIIAKSFARIFFRNAVNQGLLVIECKNADKIEDGNEIEIDTDKGEIKILDGGEILKIKPLPDFLTKIVDAGGLIEFIKGGVNMKYKIALLPGDGVGKDVMEAARIVLNALEFDAEYIYGDIGWEFWKKEGNPLPDRTIELLKETDCALFGAITSKPKKEAQEELPEYLKGKVEYFSPIVKLRQLFDLYANVRPCKAYEGNPLNYRDDIDIVVFRENTQGLYAGVEFYPVPEEVRKAIEIHPNMQKFKEVPSDEMAISLRIFTREGCRRILKKAFEYAKENKRRSVTVVEKPNVIRETSGMMIDEARKLKNKYPDIEYGEANIDAMAMWLLKNPQNYDILVTSNMFGDIISDLSAQLVGGLGFACSGNIGDEYAIFEPTHGSAPKYAGKYVVNPTAMLLSVKMMFDWLGEKKLAEKLENGIAKTIKEGKVRTYDMGGNSSTLDMAEEVIRNMD